MGFQFVNLEISVALSWYFTEADEHFPSHNYLMISSLCLPELQEVEQARQWPCRPGGLPHTLRFDPVASNTSGLFVAKITKLGSDLLNVPEVGELC